MSPSCESSGNHLLGDSKRFSFTRDHHRISLVPSAADRSGVTPLCICSQPQLSLVRGWCGWWHILFSSAHSTYKGLLTGLGRALLFPAGTSAEPFQILLISSQASTKMLTDGLHGLGQLSLCETSILLPCLSCSRAAGEGRGKGAADREQCRPAAGKAIIIKSTSLK